jgi:hypothetical protein
MKQVLLVEILSMFLLGVSKSHGSDANRCWRRMKAGKSAPAWVVCHSPISSIVRNPLFLSAESWVGDSTCADLSISFNRDTFPDIGGDAMSE